MLKLLKTEFLYSRYLKVAVGPLIGLSTYYALFVQSERIYAIFAVLSLIIIMSLFAPWKKEKRIRKLFLLPIRPSEIAIARILIALAPLAVIYFILSFTITVPFFELNWEKSYAELLFLFGLSILAAGITFSTNDILSDFKQNERFVLSIIISIIGIVIVLMIVMLCVNTFKTNLVTGYTVICLMVLASLIFLFSTTKIFIGRSSYLE